MFINYSELSDHGAHSSGDTGRGNVSEQEESEYGKTGSDTDDRISSGDRKPDAEKNPMGERGDHQKHHRHLERNI